MPFIEEGTLRLTGEENAGVNVCCKIVFDKAKTQKAILFGYDVI